MLDMKWILVSVALLATALAQDSTTTTTTTTTTASPKADTTSSGTTTSSSSTTANATTATTSKPTEQSPTAESTTSSSTTNAPSTNAPTTAAPSADGTKYFVEPCLLARLNLDLSINYYATNGTKVQQDFSLINATKTDTSACAENETLGLQSGPITLSLIFSSKDDNSYLTSVDLVYNLTKQYFPDSNDTGTKQTSLTNLELFKVKKGKSYICTNDKSIEFPDKVATLSIKHIQVEAYTNKTANDDFSTAEDCAQMNDVSDIVPIAVGCALAGLVVIVLIAYLVGRRRSRQKGYQSV